MTKFVSQFLLMFLVVQPLPAVQDTLIAYRIESQSTTIYPLAVIDSSRSTDYTDWSVGSNDDVATLSLIPPDTTFGISGFSPLIPAQNLFSVNSYPVRTAIQLYREIGDTLRAQCSGILVASQYVLTDCHCVGSYIHLEDSLSDLEFFDALWAFPAYDNGSPSPLYPGVKAIEYITFKSNISPHLGKDIALVKLEEPIGDEVGWVGIAFDINDDFFLENVFHEFSYPVGSIHTDPDDLYNGDTLFYNYGEINDITDPWIGYSGMGVSGQSGTSLLYTDNEDYFSYGTFVWSGTWHLRITPEIFYSFEAVLNADPSGTDPELLALTGFSLSDAYPNPFNSSTHLRYSLPLDGDVDIRLYDILGKELEVVTKDFKPAGEYGVDLHLGNLESGVYICRIRSGRFSDSKKLLLIK